MHHTILHVLFFFFSFKALFVKLFHFNTWSYLFSSLRKYRISSFAKIKISIVQVHILLWTCTQFYLEYWLEVELLPKIVFLFEFYQYLKISPQSNYYNLHCRQKHLNFHCSLFLQKLNSDKLKFLQSMAHLRVWVHLLLLGKWYFVSLL